MILFEERVPISPQRLMFRVSNFFLISRSCQGSRKVTQSNLRFVTFTLWSPFLNSLDWGLKLRRCDGSVGEWSSSVWRTARQQELSDWSVTLLRTTWSGPFWARHLNIKECFSASEVLVILNPDVDSWTLWVKICTTFLIMWSVLVDSWIKENIGYVKETE